MPLVPLKPLPWCWSSEGVSLSKTMCVSLRGTAWSTTQYPLIFAARCYGESSSWHWNSGGWPVWGWDSSLLRYSSQIFIHQRGCGTSLVHAPPLLPVRMDVVSLISPLSYFHSTQFLMFWVMVVLYFGCNFDVFVQWDRLHLLMLLSWLEVYNFLLNLFITFRFCSYLLKFHQGSWKLFSESTEFHFSASQVWMIAI